MVGQALAAATRTVPAGLRVHSLHSYFLRAGQLQPIVYYVARLRDGASFATRSVRALQAGQIIFHCTVSFHVAEPSGMRYQPPAPPAPPPEGLASQTDQIRQLLQAATTLNESQKRSLLRRLTEQVPWLGFFVPTAPLA